MKYNLEAVNSECFSCHQSLLATYATYQKRDYDMIFSEAWGFDYKSGDSPFGASLNPGYQERRNYLFEKFHGIKTEYVKYSSINELIEKINLALKISPVVLYCDVFNCPWNIAYQRHHIAHYIFITAIDNEQKKVCVLDPYSSKDEAVIDLGKIAEERGEINYFVVQQLENLEIDDYYNEIKNSYDNLTNSNFVEKLYSFYDEFQLRFEEIIDIQYTDEYAIPLIINLRRIAQYRSCYTIFIKQMISKNLMDTSMLKLMENIAENYSIFRLVLIRQILRRRVDKESNKLLEKIVSDECEAYNKLKLFL